MTSLDPNKAEMASEQETLSDFDLDDMADAVDFKLFKLGDLPGLAEAREWVRDHWLDNEEVYFRFKESYLALCYSDLMYDIYHSVLAAPDPALALRHKLTNTLYTLAQYVVLRIKPAPYSNETSVQADNDMGITGELWAYAMDIAEACESLPQKWRILDELPATDEEASYWVYSEYLFWNAKRRVLENLGELFCSGRPAWSDDVLAAACSMWEKIYRELLGLAPVSGIGGSDELFIKASSFLRLAESGVEDPIAAWLACWNRGNKEGF